MMECLAAVHFGPENVFVVRSEVGRMAVRMPMHNYLCVQQWPGLSGASCSELQPAVPLS